MRRLIFLAPFVASVVLAFPELAPASHLHVLVLGNGQCVVLAKDGNERWVELPAASFQNTTEPTTTANPHPLHVHVHRAQPGQVVAIFVLGSASDPCAAAGAYVNQR
jgi:hypothetical protein